MEPALIMMEIYLRNFPFPYRAGIAISNDTDGMDWAAYEDYHSFVSGVGVTPYGDGLGLEVSDSFWIWSDKGAFALRHTPPCSDIGTPSPEVGRISELVREGYLDTLHSFGDWDPEHQLTRDQMMRGLEILDKLGATPPLYVNHGGGLRLHNIGAAWASYQSGDDPEHPCYNLDLLRQAGFRFYWIDALFENDKFGENLNEKVLNKLVSKQQNRRWLKVSDRFEHGKQGAKPRQAFPGLNLEQETLIGRHLSNNLLVPLVARDDSTFWGFKRFRGHEAPNTASFALQASAEHLNFIENAGGACIIYQHFGVWRALGRQKRHVSQIESRRPLLDDNAVWAFRDIAQRQAEGRLLVTTTARLLNFLWLRNSLCYSSTTNDNGDIVIILEATECPVEGRKPIDLATLNGLAFQVPKHAGSIKLLTAKGKVLQTRRAPDPIAPDWDVVYLPWERRIFPELQTGTIFQAKPIRQTNQIQRPFKPNIRHKSLDTRQALRQYELFKDIEKRGKMRSDVKIRDDLQDIATEWSSLPVPAILKAAEAYVNKMHAYTFSDYHTRLQRLTAGGGVALDAGCGTATWSLPMANLFERVIAIDKNRARVDFARWLVERSGCQRVDVEYGDVTDLDQADGSVDFVFCFGVVISYLSLRAVLREFRRVTRPGGWIYVCVNGIGWSQHLRDDRGEKSPSLHIQGKRGFYNTYCRTRLGNVNEVVSRLLAQVAGDTNLMAQSSKVRCIEHDELTKLLLSCQQTTVLEDLELSAVRSPLGMAQFLDRLLPGLEDGIIERTLLDIARECGEEFVETFGLDLLNIIAGRRDGFSYPTAGRGYTPDEVQSLCEELGLTGFRWAGEGELVGVGGNKIPSQKFFQPEYHGKLGVWEFMVRR